MKRTFFRLPLSFCALAFAVCLSDCRPSIPAMPPVAEASLSAEEIKTLESLQAVEGARLYKMTYYGAFNQNLRQAGYKALKLDGTAPRGCTTLAARGQNGESVLARNHDFFFSPALLLFTAPPDAYTSVSVVDAGLLGFDTEAKAESLCRSDHSALLYAPFIPMDGMNECGLAVGTMYTSQADLDRDPGKNTVFVFDAMRLMLDHAKNTREAIELLGKYNIAFPVIPSHLLIADSSGDFIIVEFVKGKIRIVRSDRPWLVATNFTQFGSEKRIEEKRTELEKKGRLSWDINGRSFQRFLTASKLLADAQGKASIEDAMSILQKVALKKTSADVWMTTQRQGARMPEHSVRPPL
jgi:hypothetical protein